jgi:hypothetical protein
MMYAGVVFEGRVYFAFVSFVVLSKFNFAALVLEAK